jgi:hypothetical protein
MHKKLILSIFLIIIFVFSCVCCSKASPPEKTKISSFLPDPDDVRGWKKAPTSELYIGEDLFRYINGGAEIYHEYGFKQVLVQDFSSENGRSVSAEIYEMARPESAYGIYTFKSSTEGHAVILGNEGRFEGYYLNFWRSNFLVTLTGFDEDEETINGLASIAEAIDKRMKTLHKTEKPQLIQLLPEDEHIMPSTKYFLGNLGLFNTYPFSTVDIFKIKEGVRRKYRPGYDVFIINYIDELQETACFEDKKGKLIFIKPYRNDIIIILGARSCPDAEKITKKVQDKIRLSSSKKP